MKMTTHDWSRVRYFSPGERWGDPMEMDRELIFLLDRLRGLLHYPFVIHEGWAPKGTGGHVPNSCHYVGKAADFHIEEIPFRDAVDLVVDFIGPPPRGFGVGLMIGLGIYPHWANPGLHLDARGTFARWGAVTRGGKQLYVSWDEAYGAIR